jgi:hypothetical protein
MNVQNPPTALRAMGLSSFRQDAAAACQFIIDRAWQTEQRHAMIRRTIGTISPRRRSYYVIVRAGTPELLGEHYYGCFNTAKVAARLLQGQVVTSNWYLNRYDRNALRGLQPNMAGVSCYGQGEKPFAYVARQERKAREMHAAKGQP